jgi:hypothetical protein
MARKSFSFLALVAGFVLLGFFAVAPKTYAASYDYEYFSPNYNDLREVIGGAASGSDFGTSNIVFDAGSPYQPSLGGAAAMLINHNAPNINTVMGISFWTQSTSTSATQAVVNDEDPTCGFAHRQFVIQYNVPSSGNVNVQGDHSCGGYMSFGSTAVNATDGNWHFVAVTSDGSTMSLYIDDILRATSTLGSWIGESGTGSFHFGAFTNQTSYFTGNALCLLITSSSLSQSDVDTLWNGGITPSNCTGGGGGASSPTIPSIGTSTPMKQLKVDATTQINEGSSTDESTVVFSALLQSASTSNSLELQVEVATSTFLNTSTVTSAGSTIGKCSKHNGKRTSEWLIHLAGESS